MALYLAGISVVVLFCKHMYVWVVIAVLDPYAGRSGLFFMVCPVPAILFEKLGKKLLPLHFLFMLEVLAPVAFFSHQFKTRKIGTGFKRLRFRVLSTHLQIQVVAVLVKVPVVAVLKLRVFEGGFISGIERWVGKAVAAGIGNLCSLIAGNTRGREMVHMIPALFH